GEQPHRAAPVLELDELPVVAAVESDDRAAESGGRVLDDQIALGLHDRDRALAPPRVPGEDVAAVPLAVPRTHPIESTRRRPAFDAATRWRPNRTIRSGP